MKYASAVTDLIRQRSSCRSYGERAVEDEKRARLNHFIDTLEKPFWGNRPRFMLVDMASPGMGRVPGTYGVIKGAGIFLVGAVEKGCRDMEDFGYTFEQVILKATDLGLATCWMGLTFSREVFAEKISLASNEIIPIVSPLGYPSNRRSLVDNVTRFASGSAKRKPWEQLFFQGNWDKSLKKSTAEAYAAPLEMVRLAPSATNKQPWRILRQDGVFHFFLQRALGYDKMTEGDMQRIDMGIAMCHFELTARELGLSGTWTEARPDISLPNRCEYLVTWKEI